MINSESHKIKVEPHTAGVEGFQFLGFNGIKSFTRFKMSDRQIKSWIPYRACSALDEGCGMTIVCDESNLFIMKGKSHAEFRF
jgi:hypothetical protein